MANRKISDLTALTAPATGDLLPIVDISEAAAADKNKKITYGELLASAPAGSAAAPSFSFDGDPNTGIYNPAADTLAFVEGGVEVMRIDSSGRVGIGTSAPSNTAGFGQQLQLTGNLPCITIDNTGTGANKYSLGVNGSGAFGVWDNTASAFRMYINSSGSVGIGTTSPAARLQVTDGSLSNFYVAPGYGGGYGTLLATGGSEYLAFATNGLANERLRITSAGNVGIGTTSPSSTLHVIGTTSLNGTQSAICNSTTGSYITFQHNGTSVGDLGSGNQVFSGSTGDFGISSRAGSLTFGINAVEKARIDTSGRLLVGTSSDSGGALLQVNGDRIRVGTAKTPATSGATGTTGEIAWDANYIYVCTATNTWKRSAIATW